MRFIHTADWHLGRSFHHASLIEDQTYVLQQLIQVAREAGPDVVIIAGDVYDRAVPSTDAVDLLDDTLCKLVLEANLPVIVIAGNHDSPQRLQFGARLLESRKLYVFGKPSDQLRFLQLYDQAGAVSFYAMPYAEPATLREYWGDAQITSHEAAHRAYAQRVAQQHPVGARSVLVGHCFVAGGEASESERPLSVGDSGEVCAECFAGFDYAALGHLHRAQAVGDTIHYAGSILKYSFAEAGHVKSLSVVEMDAAGQCAVERVPLTAKRDVRCVEGRLDELLQRPPGPEVANDFVRVRLLDEGALLDAMGRLRQVYPNVMELDRPTWMPDPAAPDPRPPSGGRDVLGLFDDFFRQVTGGELSVGERVAFAEVVEQLERERREAIQ